LLSGESSDAHVGFKIYCLGLIFVSYIKITHTHVHAHVHVVVIQCLGLFIWLPNFASVG